MLSFKIGNHVLVQRQKEFDAAFGWLTVSTNGAFAVTWKDNATNAETQLFLLQPEGDLREDTELIPSAERTFVKDAKLICNAPGVNTTAIKWIDGDHLLFAINAWSSYSCQSNFTEGFVLSISKRKLVRKLSEQKLLNLPAVCTWNLVPLKSGGHN